MNAYKVGRAGEPHHLVHGRGPLDALRQIVEPAYLVPVSITRATPWKRQDRWHYVVAADVWYVEPAKPKF